MTARKFSLLLTTMAAVIVMTAGVASATTGPNCSLPGLSSQYAAGKTIGKSIVKQAWRSGEINQNPEKFEEFADIVRGIIHDRIAALPADTTDKMKCRAKGMAQGVCDELGDIQDGIVDICVLDGEVWGELSGDLYCAMTAEFGVLGVELLPIPPSSLCGDAFSESCEDEFASFAAAPANVCSSFTVGDYAASFINWQTLLCIYEFPTP